jgi:uncharacterized damage-inducible protein DinB
VRVALDQNLDLLRQGIDLLDRIDDALYRGDGATSVGPHLRHCVDAYGCLLAGLAARRVDYDERQRRGDVESLRSVGREALVAVSVALEALGDLDPHLRLSVKVDGPAEASAAWSRSTLRRELQFLAGHTVHHFALIALILRRSGFEPGHEFGVAPSTLRHWSAGGGSEASGGVAERAATGDGGARAEAAARAETVVG